MALDRWAGPQGANPGFPPSMRRSVGPALALLVPRRQAIGLGDRISLPLLDLLGGVGGDIGQLDVSRAAARRREQRDGEGQGRGQHSRAARQKGSSNHRVGKLRGVWSEIGAIRPAPTRGAGSIAIVTHQYASAEMTSPWALEPRAHTTGCEVEDLRKRTEPSTIATLAPPGW